MHLKRKEISKDEELIDFISVNSKCIFNSPEWFRVLEEGFGSPMIGYCFYDGNKLKAILPGIIFDFKIVKIFYSNIPYGGLIGDAKVLSEYFSLLKSQFLKDKIDVFCLTKKSDDYYSLPNKYKIRSAYQHIINIQGLTSEILWQNYKKRVRRDIRKAEKSGIIVRPIKDRTEVELMYKLYCRTMERNHSYVVWNKRIIDSIYDNFILQGKSTIIFAEFKGKVIAGIILIYSEDTVYYFMNGSLSEYLTYCPNDILLHTAINIGIEKKFRFIDLMTTYGSDKKLASFKEKWGGKRLDFFILEKDFNFFRSFLWNLALGLVKTPLGYKLFKLFQNITETYRKQD